MFHLVRSLLVSGCLAILAASSSHMQDSTGSEDKILAEARATNIKTLAGLKEVALFVADKDSASFYDFADVRFRSLGIKRTSAFKDGPCITVILTERESDHASWEMYIVEPVLIDRNKMKINTETWTYMRPREDYRLESMTKREFFQRGLDRFCSEWIKANP